MTVRPISVLAIKYFSVTAAVQVMFQQQLVETTEPTQAQFSVTFTPQNTEIPFTFVVETFDTSPPHAAG